MLDAHPTNRIPLRLLAALLTATTLLLTGAVVPLQAASGAKGQSAKGQGAKVIRWKDGDTVVTNRGTIRLIGVDTPEWGRCGSKKATRIVRGLAPSGTRVRLVNPSSVRNKDKYGRKLRFVQVGDADLGRRQIKRGAKARYDGLDGYDKHPRQGQYRRTDRNHADHCKGKPNGSTGGGGEDTSSHSPVAGTWNCPADARIKGNRGDTEWIYHLPHQQYYDATNPEECFATEAGARKAGYRKSKI